MVERNISPELKKNYQIVDDYCKGELRAMPDRLGYAEIYTADAMLKSLDGQRLQRLIRDIEINDKSLKMARDGADAILQIFIDLSKQGEFDKY